MSKGFWNASLLCLIIGLFFYIAGYLFKLRRMREETFKGHTHGRVVNLNLRKSTDPQGAFRDSYYPVIEYYAAGHLYRQEYEIGSWPSKYEINQELPIDFDPDDPNVWQIGTAGVTVHLADMITLAGRILIILSVLFLLIYTSYRS